VQQGPLWSRAHDAPLRYRLRPNPKKTNWFSKNARDWTTRRAHPAETVAQERSWNQAKAAVAIQNDALDAARKRSHLEEYDILRTPESFVDESSCVLIGAMVQPTAIITDGSLPEELYLVDYLSAEFPRQSDVSGRTDAYISKPSDVAWNERIIDRISQAICCAPMHFEKKMHAV